MCTGTIYATNPSVYDGCGMTQVRPSCAAEAQWKRASSGWRACRDSWRTAWSAISDYSPSLSSNRRGSKPSKGSDQEARSWRPHPKQGEPDTSSDTEQPIRMSHPQACACGGTMSGGSLNQDYWNARLPTCGPGSSS